MTQAPMGTDGFPEVTDTAAGLTYALHGIEPGWALSLILAG